MTITERFILSNQAMILRVLAYIIQETIFTPDAIKFAQMVDEASENTREFVKDAPIN